MTIKERESGGPFWSEVDEIFAGIDEDSELTIIHNAIINIHVLYTGIFSNRTSRNSDSIRRRLIRKRAVNKRLIQLLIKMAG